MLAALDAGEPKRLSRALYVDYVFEEISRGRESRRARRLLALARDVGARHPIPYVEAHSSMFLATLGFIRYADLETTLTLTRKADRLYREQCSGVAFEIGINDHLLSSTLFCRGAWREVRERCLRAVREGAGRNDFLQVSSSVCSGMNIAWLMADQPTQALRLLESVSQHYPRDRVYVLDFYETQARHQIDLYLGDVEAAHRRNEKSHLRLASALLTRLPMIGFTLSTMRTECRLGLALRSHGAARESHLHAAETLILTMRRSSVLWAPAVADLCRAAVMAMRGLPEEALQLLAAAEEGCARFQANLFARCARWRRGQLMGGETGAALVDSARTAFVQEGVRVPERIIDMFAPGFAP